MDIPVDELPTEIRRRAHERVESLSAQSKVVPWVAPFAAQIHRPDLGKKAAYVEFRLSATPKPTAKDAPSGFVVASVDLHDFPVPHFSLDKAPPSHQLARLAKAKPEALEVHKVDALCYVAERDGKEAARIGELPPLFEWAAAPGSSRGSFRAESAGGDDRKPGEHEVTLRGDAPPKPKVRAAKDWAEYRKAYAKSFAPFLDDLRRQAAPAWKDDDDLRHFGEGILAGSRLRVPLLEPDASTSLDGEGAGLVEAAPVKRKGPPALDLVAGAKGLEHEAGFTLHLEYLSGLEETLQFFVVTPGTASGSRGPADDALPKRAYTRGSA